MAVVTISSDFGAQENKVCHYFYFCVLFEPHNIHADGIAQCERQGSNEKVSLSLCSKEMYSLKDIAPSSPDVLSGGWDRKEAPRLCSPSPDILLSVLAQHQHM